MRRAQEIGIECYVCGMDAIIVQVAKEKKVQLVTFDQTLAERISPIVKAITQYTLKQEISSPDEGEPDS